MAKKKPPPTAHYTHDSAERTNIPTSETQALLPDEEQQPQTWTTRRRKGEPPTLAWDRRRKPDEFDAYPLYIREKVHPGAFVKSLQSFGPDQRGLFEDFNGLPPDASYEWYRHTGNWQNRLIHGESARVMASLAQREGLAGQVQMIFFDPPYGIGFKSNFQVAVRQRETKENRQGLPADPKMIRAFRDTYERGIDSYLDQMLEKLTLARDLLTESGSVFVQIGDENVHRMAVLLDEVFGHENRLATIPFATSGSASSKTLPSVADFLLWYAKDRSHAKYRQLYEPLDRVGKIKHMSSYVMVEEAEGTTRKLTGEERANPDLLPDGARLYRRMRLTSQGRSTTGRSESYVWNGVEYPCPETRQWAVSMEGLDWMAELGRLDSANPTSELAWKWYEEEIPGRRINNIWHQQMSTSDKRYVVQTADSVIERCLLMATDPGDLVLDPTCGAGTTAFAAEKWGRRWITCDTSTVSVAVARQRLTTAIHPFWTIRSDQIRSDHNRTEQITTEQNRTEQNRTEQNRTIIAVLILLAGSSMRRSAMCRRPGSPTTYPRSSLSWPTVLSRPRGLCGSALRSPSNPRRPIPTYRFLESKKARVPDHNRLRPRAYSSNG
ncbi:MAG: site-specific DNA-methyltransferase [bacterium]|nr:site-specific DNA-methyltransferase [bacterium]